MKKLLTFLTLLTLSIGVTWAGTVTFIAGTDTGEGSVTKDGITVSMSTMNRTDNYRCNSGSDMTISSTVGNITKVEITCTAQDSNNYGPGKLSFNDATGSYTYSGYVGTWTGNASSVLLSASAQVRMTQIVVTYNDGGGSSSDHLFYESFNNCNGTGGNDGTWANISGTSPSISPDNTGWEFQNSNAASACARFGTSSKKGTATTPSITVEDGTVYTLTFKAGAWNGGSESTNLILSATGATLYSDAACTIALSSVSMTKGAWTDYTAYIKATSTSMTITWAGQKASNSRFFLDEVKIVAPDAAAYTITITQPAEGGTISASAASANENEEVILTSNPATGYEFTAWDVKDESNNAITVTNDKFIMPASNVTVTATFSKINYNIYRTITAQNPNDQGGWIGNWNENCNLPDGAIGNDYVVTSTYGKEVQFKAGNNEGYKILAENVSAKDANNNNVPLTVVSSDNSGIVFKFNMPASNVTISAYFTFYQPDLYLMGTANDQNWQQTYKMTYSNDQYTIRAYFAGQSASDPYGYFQFEGDGTRYASGASGDYWPISENGAGESHFGDEVPLYANTSKNFRVPAGIYDIVINKDRNKVTVNPVAVNITFSPAAGSVYQGTTVTATSNLYTLLHAINSNVTESSVTNEVSLDGTTFSSSVALDNTGSATVTGKATYGYIASTATANYTVQDIPADNVYTLVESNDDLVAGAQYVLMSKGLPTQEAGYAMAGQDGNNRKQTVEAIPVNSNKQIVITGQLDQNEKPVQVITLEGQTGAWYFNVGDGYLYAASSSSNYLKTEEEIDENNNAKATIEIDATTKTAAIVFQGTNTHNILRHNASNKLFSCYESGQQPVYLFKKGASVTPSDKVATPAINPGSATSTSPYIVYGGKQEITITCATDGATIYYTTDGSTPTTSSNQYSEPFDLTSTGGNVTVKAIAVKADLDDSEIATSYYRFTNPNPPTFNPASGTVHNDAFNVTISSEYDDAVIYYMLDPASAPTAAQMSESGTLYENPVNVSGEGSHTIYAMVVRNGIKSSVVYATYTITSGGQPSGDGDYVKVTTSTDLTDGEYLIVYEIEGTETINGIVFDGNLSTLDAIHNTLEEPVEIINYTIASSDDVDAAIFTIDVTAGTIKSASGKYIGASSDANTITTSTEPLTNTISIDEAGNAVIVSSGGAYLRYNADPSQDRFRYYKSSSYTQQEPIALYKKVDKPVEELTLAQICAEGEVDKSYKISDELIAVDYRDMGEEGVYLWCKDLNNSIIKSQIKNGQIDFMKQQITSEEPWDWDQSNWVILKLPSETGLSKAMQAVPLNNAKKQPHYINANTIVGTYVDDMNYTMEVTDLDFEVGQPAEFIPNVYCATNFIPEYTNPGSDGAQTIGNLGTYYFFMNPKVNEICSIIWAKWSKADNAPGLFTVPQSSGFDGAFNVDWAYNDDGDVSKDLVDDDDTLYEFTAVIQRNSYGYGHSGTHGTRAAQPSDDITVQAMNLNADSTMDPSTGISTILAGNGQVKSVKYVNVAGMVSDVPFQGVNIVVTEYTDGSRTTSKMLRK